MSETENAETAASPNPNWLTYAGLFVVSLATMMLEVHLTRIFSVTMWYHFAFMAVSVAMFGMTAGALAVYLCPNYFTQASIKAHLARSALFFAVAIVLAFTLHLLIPFEPAWTFAGVACVVGTFAIIAVPFVLSGICVCLALTGFSGQVSRLYAADLLGAAAGCLMLILVLSFLDGATTTIVIALLASVAALVFALDSEAAVKRKRYVVSCLCLLVFSALNAVCYQMKMPIYTWSYVKIGKEAPAIYEKWNPYSRLRVFGNPFVLRRPWDWGLSPKFPRRGYSQLVLSIDSAAFSPINYYNHTEKNVDHLRYDVTNIAHYLRQDGDVMVLGVGGARDIVSALLFKQRSVLGVEINDDILHAINNVFGDYTGHLDKDPRVRFVNDEALSYVARSKAKFDIIQVSLIDTQAATAAGAFTLTENSLYTVESWRIFLDHLTPRGVLSFSRWYYRQRPGEFYRMTVIASDALAELGVKDPRAHLIILGTVTPHRGELHADGVGTMLVAREPFTKEDVALVRGLADAMGFDVVLTPFEASDPVFEGLLGKKRQWLLNHYPLNLTAPTEDSPYFFNMLRLKDVFKPEFWEQGLMSYNMHAVSLVAGLLVTVIVFTVAGILVPLGVAADRQALKGSWNLLSFFASIGLGFMLIEIAQMQKLIVFLGHPIYSLSVVLSTLLLASSLGSLSTSRVQDSASLKRAVWRLALLVLIVGVGGILTPYATEHFRAATTPERILVSVGFLAPMGFVMGMPFPLGMKLADRSCASLKPWLWGINGATSVCASVAAVFIAIAYGISAAFFAGLACYLVALVSYLQALRKTEDQPEAAAVEATPAAEG